MAQYILISNGDENLNYSIDTDTEREIARAALTAAGETSAAVYVGDPEDPSSYATGERFALETSALEMLCSGHDVADVRRERLAKAIALGAKQKSLEALRDANRTSMSETIVLPPHRYEGLSRGKG